MLFHIWIDNWVMIYKVKSHNLSQQYIQLWWSLNSKMVFVESMTRNIHRVWLTLVCNEGGKPSLWFVCICFSARSRGPPVMTPPLQGMFRIHCVWWALAIKGWCIPKTGMDSPKCGHALTCLVWASAHLVKSFDCVMWTFPSLQVIYVLFLDVHIIGVCYMGTKWYYILEYETRICCELISGSKSGGSHLPYSF